MWCDLKLALLREASYSRQKLCIRWMKEGDANTRFFHAQVEKRRVRTCIHRMKDNNREWIKELSKIEEMAVNFFLEF